MNLPSGRLNQILHTAPQRRDFGWQIALFFSNLLERLIEQFPSRQPHLVQDSTSDDIRVVKTVHGQSHHRMRKTYFFSDVHLGLGTKEEEQKKERSLVQFLDAVSRDAAEIFIVGDLFDYWFEYETVVPKGYFRLFTKLADLTESGIPITYLAGNHDFWLKGYFRDELGIRIALEPLDRTIGGKRFYLHHGDGLLKNDTGYRMLKKILRSPINIALFSLLHPDLTNRIAHWSSRKSRRHVSKRTFEEQDMVDFAEQKIREGFDYVVMGHNHMPSVRNIGSGVYVNLGDWITENSYAVFDGKRLALKRWSHTRS
jgi:UDP-2,3-diacylglucosamine hydrolase